MDTITATITNAPFGHPASDFEFLRQEGLRYIQQLAGTTWTDHNIHDPGITILDQLCYAITDVSYRMDYDIRELLATDTGNPYKSLFSAADILTVNPVTLTDLRKIILDVEGVKNAWIEKQTQSQPALYYYPDDKTLNLFESDGKRVEQLSLQGIYRVLIEKESSASGSVVFKGVENRLHNCRNLCEDFAGIEILDTVAVAVSGIVDVGRTDDIDKLAAGILIRIARFISPRLRFYTLTEMLQKGKSVDEVFEGPALEHGFIDDDEMHSYTRKTALHTSDIIREIMDEPGVSYVSNIGISFGATAAGENWFLAIDEGKTPVLNVDEESLKNLKLIFIKNGVQLAINTERVKEIFEASTSYPGNQPLKPEDKNIIFETGTFRQLQAYYSLQNHFPQIYGIGETGLPESASPSKKGRAKQLKAYLLLFEQILANYYAQTAGLKDLFSFSGNDYQTYFYQSIIDIVPGANELFNVTKSMADQNLAAATESAENALKRKNRLLDHLLARFGENLTKYALHLHSYQVNNPVEPLLPGTPAGNGKSSGKHPVSRKLVNDKLSFLADYPRISNDRGKAFNYKNDSWDTVNISGLEKRIAAKLGISNHTRRFLADGNNTQEGFHLLEHILLRPVQEDVDVLTPYRIPHAISSFEDAGNKFVKCISAGHGLQSGDHVVISGSDFYDGIREVANVLPGSFQIRADYHEPVNKTDTAQKTTAQWRRDIQGINAPVLTFTKPISGFAKKSNDNRTTVCTAPAHGLVKGDMIEISGTKNYNGTYPILNVSYPDTGSGDPRKAAAGLFEIHKLFTQQETTGRFVKTGLNADPYSLQFTCMFPGWIGRFADCSFRVFVENTVREETPAHLTVYIRWLSEPDMKLFEKYFSFFLSKLKSQ